MFKEMPTRRSILLAAAASTLGGTQIAAQPSSYPTKPITWIIPTPPGGILDSAARLISQNISSQLGQTIVVDNKPGAGGVIAAELVARSAPDGYTLLMGTQSTNAANVITFKKLPYDPAKDFVPVHALYEVSPVLVANMSTPYKTTKELIEFARRNPGKVNFASPSPGSASHLTAELFMAAANIKMTHVPYKGSAPALQDLIAGAVDVMFDYPVSAGPLINAGKLNPMAVTGGSRLPTLPNVPTIAEEGYPAAETVAWAGVFVAANTPSAIVDRLGTALSKALQSSEIVEANAKVGQQVRPDLGGAAFAQFNLKEIERWKSLVGKLSVSVD